MLTSRYIVCRISLLADRISKSLLKNKYFSGIYKINFITCV